MYTYLRSCCTPNIWCRTVSQSFNMRFGPASIFNNVGNCCSGYKSGFLSGFGLGIGLGLANFMTRFFGSFFPSFTSMNYFNFFNNNLNNSRENYSESNNCYSNCRCNEDNSASRTEDDKNTKKTIDKTKNKEKIKDKNGDLYLNFKVFENEKEITDLNPKIQEDMERIGKNALKKYLKDGTFEAKDVLLERVPADITGINFSGNNLQMTFKYDNKEYKMKIRSITHP